MTDNQKQEFEDFTEEDVSDFEDHDNMDADEEGFDEPLDESFAEEGDDFAEEDWDEYDDGGSDEMPPAGKKKSGLIFNLLIALVVLGGLGFVAMKFTGGNSAAPNSAPASAAMPNAMGTAMNANGQPAPQAANAGGNISASTQPLDAGQFVPPPSIAPKDNNAAVASESSLPMPTPTTNEAAERDVVANISGDDMGAMPVEDSKSADDNAMDAPLTPMPEVANNPPAGLADVGQAPQTAHESHGGDLTIPAKSARSDDMAKPAMTSFDAPQSMPAPASNVAAAGSSTDLSRLDQKLDKIFDRLDAMDARIDTINSDGGSAAISKLSAKVSALEKRISAMSAKSVSGSKPATVVHHASAKAPVKHDDAPAEKAGRVSDEHSWELRSAAPGQATISQSGSNNILSVSVDDKLPGLGKVQSIEVKNGLWTVTAENGVITQ